MHKSIIITGPNGSGKTSIARDISGQFLCESIAFIGSNNLNVSKNPFLFHQCHSNTKVVVIDDILTSEQLREAIQFEEDGITVHQRAKRPFSIDPFLILVCNENISKEQVKEICSENLKSFIHINIEK